MGSNRITILILLLFSFCLKAKKSPFDVSSQSGSATTALVSGVRISTVAVASGTNSTSTTTPTTNTPTAATIPAPPSNLVYTVTALQSKLIPGNTTVITPTITGTVSSWTISPSTLPPGVTFDATTGVITCSPPVGSAPFPLTNFTVTAINPGGNTTFTVPLQVLGSGENVWTQFSGSTTGTTTNANAGLVYESNCKCLYFAGTTKASALNGIATPSFPFASGYLIRYDLDGNIIWTKVFGISSATNDFLFINGITTDSSGNIYLTGSAATGNLNGLTISVGGTPNVAGYIMKYDSNGNMLWINSSSPSVFHESSAVAVDNLGFVYTSVIVRAGSMNSLTNNSSGDPGLMLIKFNASTGAYVTSTMVSGGGGLKGIQAYGNIVIDSSGNFYVSASSRSTGNCGNASSFYNPAIFKFNSSIAYISCTAIPTSNTNHSFSFGLSIDSSNNLYLSGYTQASAFNSIPLTGTTDAFLVKIFSGAIQWTKLLGASGAASVANMVAFDSSGTIYLSGMTTGNLAGQTLSSLQDMFIAKYDSSGNSTSMRYQGISNVGGMCSTQSCTTALAFDSNNTLYSSGNTTGNLGGVTNPGGSNFSSFVIRNVK